MKGIMFNTKYGLEQAVLNGTKTRNEEMPHKIKITGIKQCRLQDISEEECLREGIVRREIIPFRNIEIAYCFRNSNLYKTAKQAFADLIRKLNGRGYWESNPLGYAYEFELVK